MNRRDMIIVAAMINAGLLVVLFISAVKSESTEDRGSQLSSTKTEETVEVAVSSPAAPGDQIDQVISAYSAKVAEKEKVETKPLSLPVLTPEPKVASVTEAPTKVTEGLRTVSVEKGDVLERIARHNDVSVSEIMRLNELSNSRLQIGQVLKLPPKSASKTSNRPKQTEGKYYTVKGGDNPWTIAQKNGIQVEELLDLNNMDEEKAKKLRPGDKLRIK